MKTNTLNRSGPIIQKPIRCLVAMATLSLAAAALSQEIRATVDGGQVTFSDVQPSMTNGRVMVPIRGVFEHMNATVEWDRSARAVVAQRGEDQIRMPVNSRYATVNGRQVELDAPATIQNGRMMVPLRFLSESLGAGVQWVTATRTVEINTRNATVAPTPFGSTIGFGLQGGMRRGGGQGMQGGMMRGGGYGMQGGMMGSGMLIIRQDVQTDLNLTAAQKTKLQTVQEKQREHWQSMGRQGGGQGAGAADREAHMAQMQKMMEQHEKDIDAVLTSEQQKRLKQIKVQFSGVRCLSDTTLQKDLGLTAEQITNIEELQQKQGEAYRGLFQQMRDGSLDWETMQKYLQENDRMLETDINNVLTADQAAMYKDMKGPAFKRVDPPGSFGRPGGGMGGFGRRR